jgi:acetoin utilization protein AcuB
MLVGERMSHPVITVPPEMPIVEALDLLKRNRIRRTPVMQDGRLVGIISDKDLLNASPSPVTTLNIWEMNYLLSKVCIRDVMTREVLTVRMDTPIEEAALLMADNKIGGVPVIQDDGALAGIITETDLFKVLLELMGAREKGVRVTALVEDKPGQLAEITRRIASQGGNIIAFGQFSADTPADRLVTFKVSGLSEDQVRRELEPVVAKMVDLRTCCLA